MDAVPKGLRMKLEESIVGNAAYFGEIIFRADVDSDSRQVRKNLISNKVRTVHPGRVQREDS